MSLTIAPASRLTLIRSLPPLGRLGTFHSTRSALLPSVVSSAPFYRRYSRQIRPACAALLGPTLVPGCPPCRRPPLFASPTRIFGLRLFTALAFPSRRPLVGLLTVCTLAVLPLPFLTPRDAISADATTPPANALLATILSQDLGGVRCLTALCAQSRRWQGSLALMVVDPMFGFRLGLLALARLSLMTSSSAILLRQPTPIVPRPLLCSLQDSRRRPSGTSTFVRPRTWDSASSLWPSKRLAPGGRLPLPR